MEEKNDIDPRELKRKLDLINYQTTLTIYTATPTHSAPTGTQVLTNISDVYNLWAMIDGSWRNLTNNT